MPAIASLEDLKTAQKDLLEAKNLEELRAAFKKWRKIGWKNVCKLWLGERTPEQLKGEDSWGPSSNSKWTNRLQELLKPMSPSCEEYRDLQQLLALKKRLAENRLDPEEREQIERLVQELERKLKMWSGERRGAEVGKKWIFCTTTRDQKWNNSIPTKLSAGRVKSWPDSKTNFIILRAAQTAANA